MSVTDEQNHLYPIGARHRAAGRVSLVDGQPQPGSRGVSPMTHTVVTTDGVRISVDGYQQAERQTAVIICPGFFQSKDTPTFRRMSQALQQDVDVLAMDFRGHGRSSGRYTFSAQEGADLEAVLVWARARYRRLGVLGFSLGGAVAINVVSHHQEDVQSLVAVSAPCAFEEVEFRYWTPEAMRTGLTGLEPGAGCRPGNPFLKKIRSIDSVRHLTAIPVLLIHGTRDVIVGLQHSRRLHAAAATPVQLEIIDGGSHAEALFRDDPERFLGLIRPWFLQTLGVVGSDRAGGPAPRPPPN